MRDKTAKLTHKGGLGTVCFLQILSFKALQPDNTHLLEENEMAKRRRVKQDCASFDFDEWSRLAKEDPEGFEKKRREEIERAISEAPSHMHDQLNRLQWRIDMERKRAKNPLASCMRLYEMLTDQVYAEKGFLYAVNLLHSLSSGKPLQLNPCSVPRAKVVPFRTRTAKRAAS